MKGLVLGGGKSTRMGSDKGAIDYHGVPQVRYNFELLSRYCDEVYISVREEQGNEEHLKGLPKIFDNTKELKLEGGPSVGILSAFKSDPDSPWLVLACDMPFVNDAVIETLVNSRDSKKVATCFKNPEKGWPEPLCTIWEPRAVKEILRFVEMGKPCPRKILMNSDSHIIESVNEDALKNFNTPEELKSF